MTQAIALLTFEPRELILKQGGSRSWVAKAERVQEYPYVVLVRNFKHPSAPHDVEHGAVFLIGRISGVREVDETAANGRPRIQIDISEYAEVNIADAWGKSQNPVWFTDFETLGVDVSKLKFRSVPPRQLSATKATDKSAIVGKYRERIAELYQVSVRQIEIAIKL
ncbi:hypothetical protein [Pararhizobium sp. IMCC21322]|uniref:hypothetical protein n=1 Tax=Pararhizobium sp. IMCC21322 TaxID=3067903 RepID=UPI0027404224|nr:hypothetical protein [Pararhizobium sp. IMCC21322]